MSHLATRKARREARAKQLQFQAQEYQSRKLRQRLEHAVDRIVRLHKGAIEWGLVWRETRRGDCMRRGCGVRGRLWIGIWMECRGELGRPPFDICSTDPLCARCVIDRQRDEVRLPLWRRAR